VTADPSSSSAGAGGRSGSPSRAARPAKPSRRHAPRFHPPPRPPARGVHVHAPPRPRPARPGCRLHPLLPGQRQVPAARVLVRPVRLQARAPAGVPAPSRPRMLSTLSKGRRAGAARTRGRGGRRPPRHAGGRRRFWRSRRSRRCRRGRAWRSSDVREVVRDEDRSRSIRIGRRREMNETGEEMGFLEDLGSGSCLSDIFRHQWRKADGVEFVVIVSN